MLKLNLNKVIELKNQQNYSVVVEGSKLTIYYTPPSISEAGGIDVGEEEMPIIEIHGEIKGEEVEIIKAEIVKGNNRKNLSEDELQLWLDYISGGGG